MVERRTSMTALALVLTLAACASTPAASSTRGSAAPTGIPTAQSTATGTLSGAWGGALTDVNGSYPVVVSLDGCGTVGVVCGTIEYLDPGAGDTVMCASELTMTGLEEGRFAFSERYVYHGWMCLPTTFTMQPTAEAGLAVEQLVDGGAVCCRGTLTASPPTARPTPALPQAVAGLGRPTAIVELGGSTTQYVGAADGALWLPLDDLGAVARLDATAGAIAARVDTGDPGSLAGLKTDPHGVVAGEAGVWVAQAAARAVGRIDPMTGAIVKTIPLPGIPYALALDGTTLWATSFEDDRVFRVDLASGEVLATVTVSKPTGIAVGLGGVWVVRHRDDALVRIDPATSKVVAEISLGARGPNDLCGMCVENVVIGSGGVWTANNEGRSVSRVDPRTNRIVATIKLPLRVWAVAAGGGTIWAGQFEADANGAFTDEGRWAVAAIDPATNTASSFAFPGALGVAWAGDALWVVMPGRRGDVVVRVEVER